MCSQGRLRVRLEETIHEAPAGSFVFIPKGVPHTWQNAGDDPARILVVFTPAAAGMERSSSAPRSSPTMRGLPTRSRSSQATRAWKCSGRRWPGCSVMASQEDLAAVRHFYDEVAHGNFWVGKELFDPEIEWK